MTTRIATRAALWVLFWAVMIFEVLPLVIIYPLAVSSAKYLEFPPPGLSLQWFSSFFNDPTWTQAAVNSVVVACWAALISTVVGTMAAFAIVRHKLRWIGAINAVMLFPLIAPTIVISLGIYGLYSHLGLVGSTMGLAIGHALLGTPFVLVNVAARLTGTDRSIEKAAQNLGASPLRTFFSITLPTIRPALVAGALFAFLASWDEFIISYFVAGVEGQTLPLRIFSGIRFEVDPTNAAVAAMLVTLVLMGFVLASAASWVQRRRAANALAG